VKLPTDTERIVITGRTGSGKTQEMLWHLSQRSIGEKPWIIIDFKGDDLVSAIPVTGSPGLDDGPPSEPGLYVVRAEIEDHGRAGPLDDYLTAIYRQGATGVVIDEGIMVGQHSRGLRMLLTQGRSRECPLVILSQRPVNLDTYALSESEYLQTFMLQRPDDMDTMSSYLPNGKLDFEELRRAGPYHSIWYDVRHDRIEAAPPCPGMDEIVDRLLVALPVYADPPPVLTPRRQRV
jgi:hypothetical protein